jgi:large subunit ribosomal protein L10e
MVRLRPGKAYRRLERPYTRISRYREKSFVSGAPQPRITIFDMGSPEKDFPYRISMISKNELQIRHNALEAARIAANRLLSSKLSKENYHFKIKIYPHHVLRENPLATGAGADRFQTGMSKAFGKPIGSAARVREGQEIMYVRIDEAGVKLARQALKLASYKLPCKVSLLVKKVG